MGKTKKSITQTRDFPGSQKVGRKEVVVNSKEKEKAPIKAQWWLEEDPHSSIFGIIDNLVQSHHSRQMQNMMAAWLYQNQEMLTFRPGSSLALDRGWANTRLSFNVIQSVIDTIQSKVTKDSPQVTFLTKLGDYHQQQRAKQLTQYLQGLFDSTGVYQKAPRVFLDGEVFGTGAFFFYEDTENETIKIERVLPDELVVDELEAMDGEPRQIHRRKFVTKSVLKEQFPESSDLIDSVSAKYFPMPSQTIADVVLVVESWHLRSGKKAKDGKHAISIENATLFYEDYKEDDFPFEFFKWKEPLDGFYGLGLVHELQPLQMEISKTMRSIQLGIHYMSVPRILIEANSQVDVGHLSNTIDGQVISYVGTEPKYWVPGQVMSGDTYQWVESLIQKAYKESGVSELSATSTKPKGEVSGEALRNLHDVESERFMVVSQNWENLFVRMGQKLVKMAAKMYKDGIDISVKTPGSKWLKIVKWSDVSLDEDQYTMQAFPTSMLPNSVAGRIQTIQDLMQAGLISQDLGLSLLRFPDLDQAMSLEEANLDNACWKVSKIVEEGEMPEISPNQDLNILLRIASQTSVKIETEDSIPQANKVMLQTFIDQIKQILAPPPPPAPALPPGPGAVPDIGAGAAPPLAVPAAPPVSPLLPIGS